MKFGDNLKSIRKQRKMSQEELASKMNVSRQSVSKWEVGEAYPTMNNILELCKIFNCQVNDLVHSNMSDIDLLDEEVKMRVVKLNKDQQIKMKGISKTISILSKIGTIILGIGGIALMIACMVVPFMMKDITISNNIIKYNDQVVELTGSADQIQKIIELFNRSSNLELIIYSEIILLYMLISIGLLFILLRTLNKLFINIHNGDTPFTLENNEYIKRIAWLIVWVSMIVPLVFGVIAGLMIRIGLSIKIDLLNIILILIVLGISYIFEYGYQIQKDSNGIMYDEK